MKSIKLQCRPELLRQWADCYGSPFNAPEMLPPDLVRKLLNDALLAHELDALINNPHTANFLDGVKLEAAHQVVRWGEAHDRGKSAENWFWLVGYLAGKCLRACIDGRKEKALHHTISSAAALLNWHKAIASDSSGSCLGRDDDIRPVEVAGVDGVRHG